MLVQLFQMIPEVQDAVKLNAGKCRLVSAGRSVNVGK